MTDFGPGRSEIFGNSADSYLKVHDKQAGHADVTEGSGVVWERLTYDWTDIDYVAVREGKNLKGRFLGIVLGSIGKSRLVKAFNNSVSAVEARDYPATSSQA